MTSTATSRLPFHPKAELFPLMARDELDALVTDIKEHGLRIPITVFDGKIIEGRNRALACEEAGIEPHYTPFQGEEKDVVAFIISANIHRRHLTNDQKNEILKSLLAIYPEKSDREIGRMSKRDNKTVAAARQKMEAGEEIPHVEARTDTRGRKQPAKKPKPKGYVPIHEERRRDAVKPAKAFSGLKEIPGAKAGLRPLKEIPGAAPIDPAYIIEACVDYIRRLIPDVLSDLPPSEHARLFSAVRQAVDTLEAQKPAPTERPAVAMH